MSVIINKNKYRESTIVPYQKGYFPLYLKPGYYEIGYEIDGLYQDIYFDTSSEDGQLVYGQNSLRDVIIKDEWILLNKLYYYSKDKHTLNIYSMINYLQNKFIQTDINIFLNDKLIINKVNYNDYFSNHYTQINNEGFHYISMYAKSNSTICSCPSSKNGYYQNRNLVATINPYKENKSVKYKDNQNILIKIPLISDITY